MHYMPEHGNRRRPCLAYVAHTLNPGGTERLAVDMALAFSSRYDVRMICLDQSGLWASQLRERGIPVHCLWRQPGFDPGVALRLARLLRAGNVDLVHAHQCTPWFYAALARVVCNKPRLLLEEHGRFHPEVRNPLRILVNCLLIRRLTQAFVAVSADIRERLATYEGLERDAIRVVYNGARPLPAVSVSERTALRAELGFGDRNFVIGTVGRLDPIKNLPLLLRAFRILLSRHASLHLLIVGDGPERSRIERLIREQRLESAVTLTGFRGDARRLLTAFDLFTMTSFSEGTSMALLEAMSAGLPVAVSRVGGNPEILRDGETGLLFASDDIGALVAALERLYMDDGLRQRLATAAQAEFRERFSFDAMIDQYSKLYSELLDRRT
jgi:glycosyltransferase involved in cell wall biosynthesis